MKLEKREITLNEYDSLKDAYYREKILLNEYVCGLSAMERKETREEILLLIRETAEEIFLLQDLLQKSAQTSEE
jgi:hypothetical protein